MPMMTAAITPTATPSGIPIHGVTPNFTNAIVIV